MLQAVFTQILAADRFIAGFSVPAAEPTAFIGGWPSLETVLPKLKKNGIHHVTLMPMMMVAGDHANNDMAGAEPDSHKSILEAAGYKVDAYIHGIGENAAIQSLYLERANDAWNALEAK
mgnify:CR=1 FL=1